MRPFLGRVPIRVPGSRSLGQVEFWDPWGGHHAVTVEPAPPPETPFDPTLTKEQAARYQREGVYDRKIKAKEQECEILKANMDAHKSYYYDREESGDEEYQNYGHAVDEYNDCLDKIAALEDELKTVPSDFGTTESGYQWPAEVPEPTGRPFNPEETPYVHHPEDYPPVASTYEWPEEVPKPGDWPPEESPELVEPPPPTPPVTPPVTPPETASVDLWRTSGCPAGTARLVRGGMCVSTGVVSSALTTPMTTPAGPTFTMGRAMLGQVRLARRPGMF